VAIARERQCGKATSTLCNLTSAGKSGISEEEVGFRIFADIPTQKRFRTSDAFIQAAEEIMMRLDRLKRDFERARGALKVLDKIQDHVYRSRRRFMGASSRLWIG
jgi:hypothetical protein